MSHTTDPNPPHRRRPRHFRIQLSQPPLWQPHRLLPLRRRRPIRVLVVEPPQRCRDDNPVLIPVNDLDPPELRIGSERLELAGGTEFHRVGFGAGAGAGDREGELPDGLRGRGPGGPFTGEEVGPVAVEGGFREVEGHGRVGEWGIGDTTRESCGERGEREGGGLRLGVFLPCVCSVGCRGCG